jgi:hypothetical protein
VEETFIEVEEEMVRDRNEHGRKWRGSMRYLKLKCEGHQDPCRLGDVPPWNVMFWSN